MQNRTIFLYANQPVFRCGGHYYAKIKNFLDFLIELAKQDEAYRLVIPCQVVGRLPEEGFIPINLPDEVIEVSNYVGHRQDVRASFSDALRIRSQVLSALNKMGEVTIAGAGPDLFLFLLSLVVPKSVRFAFFIRGDKLEMARYSYKGSFFYPLVIWLLKLFRWRIRSLVAQSRAQVFLFGEKLKEQYPGNELAIHIIAPLIDTSFVREDVRPNISEGRPLKVLYVGRLSGEKNILSLIDACVMAYKDKHSFILSIVGYGPLETEIRNRIAESGLSTQVNFLGYVPHGDALIAEFDSHDLLCLPSHTEGIPRAVIEAFARRMPVLATPVGSLPTRFPDKIRFLDGFDTEAILKGIDWCNTHRTEFSAMGKEGHKAILPFLIHENAIRVDKILRSSI